MPNKNSPTCPRCAAPLEAATVHGTSVSICPESHGLSVPQNRMIMVLEGTAQQLAKEISPDTPIAPAQDVAADAACPTCSQMMKTFGYLGMDLAMLDRCTDCEVVWFDAEELGVAAMMLARTEARRVDRDQEVERALSGIQARLEVATYTRGVIRRMRIGRL